jgi:mono/diheme cytochrome c family protein
MLLLARALVAQDGRAVFGEYCSIPYCHDADGGEGRAPALRGRSWHEEDLRRIIIEGVPDTSMPPFGDRLAAEEIESLIAFLRSISVEIDSSERDVVRASDRAPDGQDNALPRWRLPAPWLEGRIGPAGRRRGREDRSRS